MPSSKTVRRLLLCCSLGLIAIASVSCGKKAKEGAHTLVLKDGTILRGELISRTDAGVKFETGGEVREIAMDQVHSLTLKEGEKPVYLAGGAGSTPEQSQTTAPPKSTRAPQQESAAAPAKPAPPEPKPVTVAAGTKLAIKTKDNLGTATHQTGAKFTAVLEADLVSNGVVVAPKGTTVNGKVLESSGGKRVGTQRLVATFTEISINNQLVAIDTDEVGAEGGRAGTARKVGAGALIGAAAGDAGAGAAVGAALALLGPGGQIQIPAGTLVEVSLKQSFTVMK
ncbi:MAG: hypothetical protein ACREOO_01650 [bacterium]